MLLRVVVTFEEKKRSHHCRNELQNIWKHHEWKWVRQKTKRNKKKKETTNFINYYYTACKMSNCNDLIMSLVVFFCIFFYVSESTFYSTYVSNVSYHDLRLTMLFINCTFFFYHSSFVVWFFCLLLSTRVLYSIIRKLPLFTSNAEILR